MKNLISIFILAALLFNVTYSQSTSAQAESLVKKAVQFYKEKGKEAAFAEFSNPAGKFTAKDLYIFVVDLAGNTLAHGGNAKLVGKNMMEVKDPDGKFFIKECIEIAKAKGKGWSDYKWSNPATKKIEAKTTYVEKADDFVFGCGVYKK